MAGTLPPELGAVVEQLFGKAALSGDGSWIDEYAKFEDFESHGITVSRLHVKNEDMAGLLSKSVGQYSTLQTGPLNSYERHKDICNCLTEELRRYLEPYKGKTLCICGIGNADWRFDSLGPETAKRITPEIPVQSDFEKITVFCPGADGLTNISTPVSISGVASAVDAACVIAIDATNCSSSEDLCSCIQLTNAEISFRQSGDILSQSSIGIPVVCIGVPTAIHAEHLSPELKVSCDDFLTVSRIDIVIKMTASVIATSILRVIYPELDYDDCKAIVDNSQLY